MDIKNKSVEDIMTKEVITIREDETVETCANMLSDHNLSGLPVVNSMGQIKGIVTDGDLIRRISRVEPPAYIEVLGGLFYLEKARELMEDMQRAKGNYVTDIMTEEVYTIGPDASIEDAATLMVDKKIKRLPVIHKDTVIGIISRKDVMNYLFEKK